MDIPAAAVEYNQQCEMSGYGSCSANEQRGGWAFSIIRWKKSADEAIGYFNAVPNIRSLHISDTSFCDTDFQAFRNMSGVQRLAITNLTITGAGLDYLPECKSVEELDIRECPLDGELLKGLRKFPNVRKLSLEVHSHADEALKHMQSMTHLESLFFVATEDQLFQGSGLVGLAEMKSLESISIPDTTIERGFENLVKCDNLKTLSLSGSRVSDLELQNISRIKSLVGLYIRSEEVSDLGLSYLQGHKSLRHIGIIKSKVYGGPFISEVAVSHISKIPCIESVWLLCPLSEDGLEKLTKIQTLNRVTYDSRYCTPYINDMIRKLPRIVFYDLAK